MSLLSSFHAYNIMRTILLEIDNVQSWCSRVHLTGLTYRVSLLLLLGTRDFAVVRLSTSAKASSVALHSMGNSSPVITCQMTMYSLLLKMQRSLILVGSQPEETAVHKQQSPPRLWKDGGIWAWKRRNDWHENTEEIGYLFGKEEFMVKDNKFLLEITFAYLPWLMHYLRKCLYDLVDVCDDMLHCIFLSTMHGVKTRKERE